MSNPFNLQPSAFSPYLPTIDRDRVLYVDSINGNDSNRGNLLISPVRTLTHALSRAVNNSLIVLQSGSYGSATVNKQDISIRGAYGTLPTVTSITATDSSIKLDNLNFSGASTGVSLINSSINKGSISLQRCKFNSIANAVSLTRCRSVSMHQNEFISCSQAVVLFSTEQAAISSNVVDNSDNAFSISSVSQLDFFLNTINRSSSLGSAITPGAEIHALFHTITAQDIINKYFIMPYYLLHVAINVVYGPSFALYTDFIFSGNIILWENLGLDGELDEGDILRIIYSRTNPPATGSAVLLTSVGSGSRIDSNNITNANVGVFLSDNIKVTNNNFFNTITATGGSTPLVNTGNISSNPNYINSTAGSGNFHLQVGSASIQKANKNRWEDVFSELSDKWSGVSFNRNIDKDGVNRFYIGKVTGDIGSYEFITGSYAGPAAYVSEYGYDYSYFGSVTKPFITPDRAFSQAGSDPITLTVGSATGLLSSNVGRFLTKNLELSNSDLTIGSNRSRDYAVLYPSYPKLPTTDNVYVDEDTGVTGNGSFSFPYRNIDQALEEIGKPNVILLPGRHVKFSQGVSGKRVIPLKITKSSTSTKMAYSQFNHSGWNVGTTGTIVPDLGTKALSFDYTTRTGQASVSSIFSLSNDSDGVEVKFKVLIGTDLSVEVYTSPASTILVPPNYPTGTPNNALFFTMTGTAMSVGYRKLTVENSVQKQLSFPTTYSLEVFELVVHFLIKGSSFKIWVKGDQVDIYREGSFDSLYNVAWKVKFISSDSTAIGSTNISTISNLKLVAGDITGVSGIGVRPDNIVVGRGPSVLAGS